MGAQVSMGYCCHPQPEIIAVGAAVINELRTYVTVSAISTKAGAISKKSTTPDRPMSRLKAKNKHRRGAVNAQILITPAGMPPAIKYQINETCGFADAGSSSSASLPCRCT